ncbi:MAG TPA: DUF192 domain-containing protein [Acidimicrobiia bacterium]|nr:DUF192 domain-containing protein [Acidimicrobiia bacterium]
MSPARRAGVAAVLLALAAALVGGGLLLLLRRDDETATPGGPLGSVLAGASPATAPFTGLTELRLGIGGDCRHVVVADNTNERATGLMRRNDLGSYDGMLFVFDQPTSSSFTMSDVPVPLDIAWYDEAGRPVDRLLMQPCPDGTVSECPAYSSRAPYSYAVETLGGELPGGALSGCP